ncbi:MAG: ABC transporter permease subunit [Candidatus Sumerlaeaceae bacterium]|nr:ABC transporter permease subunit [Candidatus Sumerlaeaceae bacterium]
MRAIWLIARSVLLEAVRRKEIYAIVLISCLIIAGIMSIDFFGLRGLTKFYCEVSLQVMSTAAALTTIALAARQLPREFEARTIYPLLAKPVSRMSFILGKLLGVMLAAAFCFALFMAIYIGGTIYMGGRISPLLILQYVYLQLLGLLILATLAFCLSLWLNFDAAMTIGAVLYFAASIIMTSISYLYDFVGSVGKLVLKASLYGLPQLRLVDLSEKVVHSDVWSPIPAWAIAALTCYAFVYSGLYLALAYISFRRKPL